MLYSSQASAWFQNRSGQVSSTVLSCSVRLYIIERRQQLGHLQMGMGRNVSEWLPAWHGGGKCARPRHFVAETAVIKSKFLVDNAFAKDSQLAVNVYGFRAGRESLHTNAAYTVFRRPWYSFKKKNGNKKTTTVKKINEFGGSKVVVIKQGYSLVRIYNCRLYIFSIYSCFPPSFPLSRCQFCCR
jgi:hypothetical protein